MKIYFMGIGGISMSGLAKLYKLKGHEISGSDITRSDLTDELIGMGITVYYKQEASNITPDIDKLVYTAAIRDDNPELMRAKELGIPLITRAEVLGKVMSDCENPISIAGTHGKTTVTGMLSQIFLTAGHDPSISIGGVLPVINSNFRAGSGNVFIAESCEYKNSFLSLKPKYGAVLNIEADHLDFFKDLSDIRHSFREFISGFAPTGALVINGEIEDIDYLTADIRFPKENIITYGLSEEYEYYAGDIAQDEKGHPVFNLYHNKEKLFEIRLSVFGIHNISNAVASSALALTAGISGEHIKTALYEFTGTGRRFELKGHLPNGVTIIDDYAHHPTEIKATLTTAKKLSFNRVVCIFQPHTYSRTKALLEDFVDALSLADLVILPDIYPAREPFDPTISSGDIARLLTENGIEAHYIPTFEESEKFLRNNCIDKDLLITMGAGNVNTIGESLLKG